MIIKDYVSEIIKSLLKINLLSNDYQGPLRGASDVVVIMVIIPATMIIIDYQ